MDDANESERGVSGAPPAIAPAPGFSSAGRLCDHARPMLEGGSRGPTRSRLAVAPPDAEPSPARLASSTVGPRTQLVAAVRVADDRTTVLALLALLALTTTLGAMQLVYALDLVERPGRLTAARAANQAIACFGLTVVVAAVTAVFRRGRRWPVNALVLTLVGVIPFIRADAFHVGVPQAFWVVPMLAFVVCSLRWALAVTALCIAAVVAFQSDVGGYSVLTSWLVSGVVLLMLVSTKLRAGQLLAAQQAQAVAMVEAALYDSVTGLPNRRLLADRLGEALKQARRGRSGLAVLFIDLDHFKGINDALGHDKGDRLLVEAVRRIRSVVRTSDTVARWGADVFVVVLGNVGERTAADRVTEAILQAIRVPFELLGQVIPLTASIGVAYHPDDGDTVESLLTHADHALTGAKDAGRDRASYFTSAMQEDAERRLQLVQELRFAVARGQLRLHYQPIVELGTGEVHKAEALVRWEHPAMGMVSPAVFIPLAESSGLIHEVGDWVFAEAARQAKAWRAGGVGALQVSVNRSPAQFSRVRNGAEAPSWPDQLRALGLPGDSVALEITEGLLLDASKGVGAELEAMRAAGIPVLLDDFGTGYSALAYLQRYPIDVVKIDRAFVRALAPDSKNFALCRGIISMAHDLGMKVVAEGVETAGERDLLVQAGCDYAQGYLYGKPMPAPEFEAWLARRRGAAAT
jgi:diguanylate cyclase (GGDEF)-like protein